MLRLANPEEFNGVLPMEDINDPEVKRFLTALDLRKGKHLKMQEAEAMRIATATLIASDNLTADLEANPSFKKLLDRDFFVPEKFPEFLTSSDESRSVLLNDPRVDDALRNFRQAQKEQPGNRELLVDLEDKIILSLWNVFFESYNRIRKASPHAA